MTDILDMTWDKVYEAIEKISGMSSEEKQKIGDKAFDYIGDYPLYASGSNITYDEAILIALVVGRDDFVNSLEGDND